jgi:pyruvate/2-oxoacid:ferredoxin oxidoreductase beta subunit/formate hydrogenlyase subunit 6/NADH:ubiquinone oxidoreductase subunit I
MTAANKNVPADGILETIKDFSPILEAYATGKTDELFLPDEIAARSIIPPGTAGLRDFSYIAPDIPRLVSEKCVACLECVNLCPDTAILAKVVPEDQQEKAIASAPADKQGNYKAHEVKHPKYYQPMKAKGKPGGIFNLYIDPTKCKGCAECVEVCGTKGALVMESKEHGVVEKALDDFAFFKKTLPDTPEDYISKAPADVMLDTKAQLFVGGAGSCMGCGEGSVIRMVMGLTGKVAGRENIGVLGATGCNSVFSSTYPYNPFLTSWSNSLFENVTTYAMGVRLNWDQKGWGHKRLWTVGGDGAMTDIGFQALSRLLASGMDIKVLVLDTQVYSNTGGQASTASFMGQNAKMSAHGRAVHGKVERRKELGLLSMMHPDVYVAQVIASNLNHFYRAIQGALEFPGPAVILAYTACMPEHGIPDDAAARQAKLAADCRVFPLFIHDPRKGEKMSERLSLVGNVAADKDYFTDPKSGEVYDFIKWARTEGRFAKQFDKEGNPSDILKAAAESRLRNWHQLQELAGLR